MGWEQEGASRKERPWLVAAWAWRRHLPRSEASPRDTCCCPRGPDGVSCLRPGPVLSSPRQKANHGQRVGKGDPGLGLWENGLPLPTRAPAARGSGSWPTLGGSSPGLVSLPPGRPPRLGPAAVLLHLPKAREGGAKGFFNSTEFGPGFPPAQWRRRSVSGPEVRPCVCGNCSLPAPLGMGSRWDLRSGWGSWVRGEGSLRASLENHQTPVLASSLLRIQLPGVCDCLGLVSNLLVLCPRPRGESKALGAQDHVVRRLLD